MPSSEQPSPRPRVVDAEYSYRRPLRMREMLPAIGVAIGAGFLAFYIARLLLQRTPLRVDRRATARVIPEASEHTARP